MIFLHRGQFEGARRCFEQALEETRAAGQPHQLRAVLLNLGNTAAALGDRELALYCFARINEIQKRYNLLPDPRDHEQRDRLRKKSDKRPP